MAHVICRRSDGVALAALHGTMAYDAATHVAVEVSALPPDLPAVRWDGATGLRAATALEQQARADELLDDESLRAIDGMRALKALALVVGDLTGQTPAQMRTRFIQRYKGL